MSKNIKGKNLDININITQAGTMNADIFNAYQDFTLNGVSIVNRIATNEGDIALLNTEVINLQDEINENETDIATNTSDIATLQTSKQDVLTFDSTPTAGSNNPVSSQGIKTYVDGSTPSITATAPINYSGGVISGTFDATPTNGSINFLSSDKVFDALALKQDEITSSTSLTTANITANGNIIGLGSLAGASVLVSGEIRTTAGDITATAGDITSTAGDITATAGDITATAGTITAPTIIQGTTNLLNEINTKQDEITSSTSLTTANITANGNIIGLGSLAGASVLVSGEIRTTAGDITATAGTITAPTIIQGTTNLLNEINTKQDTLTFDTTPTAGSNNPVSSQGIKTYVDGSTPSITATAPINYSGGVISGTFDNAPTNGSVNFLSSDKVFDALALKQDTLTFDTAPTAGSNNPVSSQGIKTYVDNSTPSTITANLPLDYSSATGVIRGIFDSVPTNSSINFLNSNVIYDALQLKQDEITSTTSLTTANITANGNITAIGGLTGASALVSGLVSGANLEATALVSGASLQVNNSAGNQITCLGTGNSVFSDVLCGDITSSGSISTTSGQIGTTSGSISTSSGDIITSTGDITAPAGTISAGTISATGASGTITAPIIIQGTTNLLNEINTKQDLITSTTSLTTADITANGNITASSLSTTGSLLMTGGSSQISNSGAYNGAGNIITSANIIGTDFITNSGTNILTKINTKQDLITSSTALTCGSVSTTAITGNPVIACGAVNCNSNITTASNITCGGDLSAIGSGNNIDLRNNLVAGAGISLSQTGNNTTINNTATGTSQLYYFKATSNRTNPVQAITTGTILDYNDIIYDVPSGNYDTTAGAVKYVVPIAGTFQFFFQAFQLEVPSDFLRVGIYQNNNLMGMGGGYVGNCERVGVILECAVGDVIQVKGVSGNEQVYMAANYSWFEGYLLAGSSQLSTSTQYYFKAKGSGNQSISTGATNQLIDFNVLVFQNPTGYNTSNKEYVVQVAGLYQFFYQIFFLFNNANAEVRFGLYLTRGGTTSTISQTGQYIYTAERLGLTYECLVGDRISVRVVYNNSGGVFNIEKGQSWFEGYLLQPENNTITDTTNLTLNSLTADISPNLNAGSNISISTTSGVSTISSSIEYLIMTNTSDFTMTGTGASTYSFVFNNTKTTSSNINYNALTQEFSFNSNGTYLVSFSCNVFNTGHNGRVVGRTRVVKNASYVVGDGVCYFYIRDDNFGNRETCSLSNCPIFITNFSTDKIKLNFTCNKDANGGFSSPLTGLKQAEGCLVSFVKIA